MSETRAFDTHAAVKVLTGAGAKPELAEAFVTVARDAGDHGDHVTPDRLDAALANLRGEIGRDLRILTAITLPCACHAEPQKTGRGWVQVATLYRSLSLPP